MLSQSSKGIWMRKLILDVAAWIGWRYGELNYHITQILSCHPCFNAFLFKIRKTRYPNYSYCEYTGDMTEHTVFGCTA